MKLTAEDIRHVAKLARLQLDEADVARYVEELGRILGYMEKLSELDTADVLPTSSVGRQVLPLRADEVHGCLSPEQALANAPDRRAGHFRVPRVVE